MPWIKMVVKHKYKKTCFVLMKALMKDHKIEPGTLFKSKPENKFYSTKNAGVEDYIFIEKSKNDYITLKKDECILFIDVAYDPWTKQHFFRFLANSKILVIPFIKGQTIKALKANFEIKISNVSDVDKQ